MVIRFNEQILIGRRVYGPGEVASLPRDDAQRLIDAGIASEAEPDPAPVREAVANAPARARRAVRRGGAGDAH